MKDKITPEEIVSKFPVQVFNRLIADITADTWAVILKENPEARKEILGGFSLRPNKLDRILSQPVTMVRLQRRLKTDIGFLDRVLDAWAEEFSGLGYLSMLDGDFVAARWRQLRDLLGPERFCLSLFSLGAFEEETFTNLLAEKDFWTTAPDRTMLELLLLPLAAWGQFVRENPEAAQRLQEGFDLELGPLLGFDSHGSEQEIPAPVPEPESAEPSKKLEKKLQKTLDELSRANDQVAHMKAESEELRKKLKGFEADLDRKVRESVSDMRKELFARYGDIEPAKLAAESSRLGSLVQRTKRALELQARADEEYGLISELRARLLDIDLSLAGIESVFANSLVVHKEVEKVKEALLGERTRLLAIPGIGRVIADAHTGREGELVSRINLMDPVPACLPNLNRLRTAVQILSDSGLIDDAAEIEEAVRHKRKQILEGIYSRFEPRGETLKRDKSPPQTLDDFVGSGESRRYDLFVDGYNVLLRAHGENEEKLRRNFTELREQFVAMVLERSPRFARVFLVFDGTGNSREVRGNTEIIYTDKKQRSADAVIIEKVRARKDKKILLVTADEEIISATRERTFALIDPIDFYMFVFV